MDTDSVHLFDLHHNPNDACIVGHNIRPVLGGMFQQMDDDVNHRLQGMTLADCISDMLAYMARTGQADPRQDAANHSSRTGAADARE